MNKWQILDMELNVVSEGNDPRLLIASARESGEDFLIAKKEEGGMRYVFPSGFFDFAFWERPQPPMEVSDMQLWIDMSDSKSAENPPNQ